MDSPYSNRPRQRLDAAEVPGMPELLAALRAGQQSLHPQDFSLHLAVRFEAQRWLEDHLGWHLPLYAVAWLWPLFPPETLAAWSAARKARETEWLAARKEEDSSSPKAS